MNKALKTILLTTLSLLGACAPYLPQITTLTRDSPAGQAILVVAPSRDSPFARLYTYEKNGAAWRLAGFNGVPATIGRNGLGKQREGDGKSPEGTMRLLSAFGTGPKPEGVKIDYRQTTAHDVWVDDTGSPDYNTWKTYDGDPADKWKSVEKLLLLPCYKYAVVVDYNINPVVKGSGSAIFLHVWRNREKPTAGCTAVSEENMVKILKWLDPRKNPVIIQTDKGS
jgi:L,D-peptidoglycan transpeptidase YkuD (ErfK/YbiS/YcfS/YnhG family)